jgi:osmotically-inducible protein OsmY
MSLAVKPAGMEGSVMDTALDTELAKAVLGALQRNTLVPDDQLAVIVDGGWVTLTGHVRWEYQRDAAVKAVQDVPGVRSVTSAIVIEPHVSAMEVGSKIETALKRAAEHDARHINIAVTDTKVTLTGTVHSLFERVAARRAAWSAPGVTEVNDNLAVVP